ncbi:hypothetical protein MSIM_45330 [Mycobacterium simiae]|nr:hypothetical protein MSIM_45330 [Mycobacterium simiae]
MIEADAVFAEFLVGRRLVVLMDAEDRAAVEEPHLVSKAGIGVFVEGRIVAEEIAIPGAADLEIAHRDRNMIESRKRHAAHGSAPAVVRGGRPD